ncbi:phosphoglycerate mutase [Salipiger pallidus]|uniref:Phosphoglycerate mutase n=1 Tax=Salipiger pallidus TaxID=1775170 RepID=A0A8J2ZJ34_9RHOB|nr:histidine phosphatase family protein [Salipiger pallidus]GGG68894.1 phosphoglycerate mutase [Salipiger pallidus]
MKRLILMRHAKSDWSLGQPDHERTLNKRGRQSAKALGRWLAAEGLTPDQVLCSTATRTRETLKRLALDPEPQTVFEDRLYHAGPESMFRQLSAATGTTVLMVGHNPGIAAFADEISATAPPHPRFHDYPTGATLVVEFDIDVWADLAWQSGVPRGFVIPRELLDSGEA